MSIGSELDAALAEIPAPVTPFDPSTLQGEITALQNAVAALQPPLVIPPVIVPPDHPPVIQTIPTLTFFVGKPQSISLLAFCSDPDGDKLTLSLSGTLLPGITFDGTSMNYDGAGAVASAPANQLFANDGKP